MKNILGIPRFHWKSWFEVRVERCLLAIFFKTDNYKIEFLEGILGTRLQFVYFLHTTCTFFLKFLAHDCPKNIHLKIWVFWALDLVQMIILQWQKTVCGDILALVNVWIKLNLHFLPIQIIENPGSEKCSFKQLFTNYLPEVLIYIVKQRLMLFQKANLLTLQGLRTR